MQGVMQRGRRWRGFVWVSLFTLSLSILGCAAKPAPAPSVTELAQIGFRPPEKEKTAPASREMLAQFEGEINSVYRLGEGDEITVDVWDRAEISGRHVIGPDGRISLPIAGPVRITGYAREDVAKLISEALSHYYLDLVVSVRVEQYVANRVVVLGRVSNPGVVRFENVYADVT